MFVFCVTRIGKAWECMLGSCTSLWCCNWKRWKAASCRVEISRYYQFSFAWCCLQEDRQFGWKKRTWFNIGIDDHQSLVSFQGVEHDERWGKLMVTSSVSFMYAISFLISWTWRVRNFEWLLQLQNSFFRLQCTSAHAQLGRKPSG